LEKSTKKTKDQLGFAGKAKAVPGRDPNTFKYGPPTSTTVAPTTAAPTTTTK
jgi:hypothetical protein